MDPQRRPAFARNNPGGANWLTLPDDEVLANLKDIQLRGSLPPYRVWSPATSPWRWTPEPGRPHVYRCTILELNSLSIGTAR